MTKSMLGKLVAVAFVVGSTAAYAQGGSGGGAGGASAGSTSGVGHGSSGLSSSPAPGVNSAGTAQSSGVTGNMAPGVTTGQASSTDRDVDAAIANENRETDGKLKGICRGC